ncbi:hypothetical protein E2562_029290 [Oryza meyeriana var. granulata]|uniref:DUF834 domain-containing protein n=1 Tax=Oryza meyeriana var. granulata TaxID=110450 RepID=A0A6G1BP14_9ORYZ|nr:hypothetical protein E2562_029290 [Oryza meyeriana var. granulata]
MEGPLCSDSVQGRENVAAERTTGGGQRRDQRRLGDRGRGRGRAAAVGVPAARRMVAASLWDGGGWPCSNGAPVDRGELCGGG